MLNLITQGAITHNVPAVYEVLAARISKRKSGQSILTPPFFFFWWPKSGGDKTAQRR
jgi:hypothetical protein